MGAFRYIDTWNVQVVLECILQWGDTTSLSLKLLTYKLVMLMSLVRPSRFADLASLCIDHMSRVRSLTVACNYLIPDYLRLNYQRFIYAQF